MQGVEGVLLQYGAIGAIAVALAAAVVVLWRHNQQLNNTIVEDLRQRDDAWMVIVKGTLEEELELGRQNAQMTREIHTTLTLLTKVIKELFDERPRDGRGDSG